MNEKVYIHEFIDIIGHNRSRYMYHMTANWSPAAMEDRHQLCFGVWGVVGSTGHWPQVVNLWEEDGFEGLARSFGHELGHRDLQDPKLAAWWAAAASLRAGGVDRLLVPAPWMPTIEELCANGTRGVAYGHEQIRLPRGTSQQYLEIVRQEATPVTGEVRVGSGRSVGNCVGRRQRVLPPLGHPHLGAVGRARASPSP